MATTSSRLAVAAVLVAASLVDPAFVRGEVVKPHYRKVAPGFTLSDNKRAPITLSDFKGKVVLLDFWATWCAASKVEMPWYVEFESRYRNSGLAIIGVSMDDEGWAIVSPYLEGRPVTYPVVLGDHDVADRFGLASCRSRYLSTAMARSRQNTSGSWTRRTSRTKSASS